mmetsp:Transcript_11774/g.36401  ORF Transcript_11774/g.36401 Transcript_11774/m.36401 type:complete len:145 (-) Transcript_11774:175-609(-)
MSGLRCASGRHLIISHLLILELLYLQPSARSDGFLCGPLLVSLARRAAPQDAPRKAQAVAAASLALSTLVRCPSISAMRLGWPHTIVMSSNTSASSGMPQSARLASAEACFCGSLIPASRRLCSEGTETRAGFAGRTRALSRTA